MANRFQLLLLGMLSSVGVLAEDSEPFVPTIGNPIPQEEEKKTEAKIDSEVFEVGLYGGLLTVEDFGTQPTAGVVFNFHATEDFFLQANYAQTTVGKASFETLAGQDVTLLTDEQRELQQFNFLVGYNLFPGEAFITPKLAFNTAFYLVGGVGNVHFANDNNYTFTIGSGYRVILTDWITWNIDYRDHIFNTEILGEKKLTHNLEFTSGFTVFF